MSNIDFSTLKPGDVGKLSKEDVQAYIAYLTETRAAAEAAKAESDAKVKALEQAAEKGITFKVGPRGGLNVYGINAQYPICAYGPQWRKLFAGNKGAEPGSTFERFLKALDNPELSTGKDDPRYSGATLVKRLAEAEAARAAKQGKTNSKTDDTQAFDPTPRIHQPEA